MKYTVRVMSNFNTVEFESNSRNAKQHLINNGGYRCEIVKNGEIISACEYSEEFGYYYVVV